MCRPLFQLLYVMLLASLVGCFDVTIPAEDESGADQGGTTGTTGLQPDGPGDPRVAADASGGGLNTADSVGSMADAGVVLPPSCDTHCDCPPDFDCINQVCVVGPMPIQCCSHPKCPSGARCWSVSGVEGICDE